MSKRKISLRRGADRRRRRMEVLDHNIPGGAHQFKDNDDSTFISMPDSFLSMVGYIREEVETLFHNHFIEMILPKDRGALREITRQQLQKGREIELEYRLVCKSGQPIWILEKRWLLDGGSEEESFFCLLIENTARKQKQEELWLSLERYQIIVDQATDIIFEWDIKKDTLFFSSNWLKKFDYEPIYQQISENIPLSRSIHPSDMPAFVKIMRDTTAGVPYSETEFRIKAIGDRYVWCRIRAATLFDSERRAIRAAGVITDISNEKRQVQVLLNMAQHDALAGLYNKATINLPVERCMEGEEPDGMQALFILDVDYFKAVNNNYGHLAGDSLFPDVAETIRKNICHGDLAGRISGDEFLIYPPHVSSRKAAMKKAEKLIAAVSMLSPEIGAPPISCSVEAAVFSYGELAYQESYKCADRALYARKRCGRGGVTPCTTGMGVENFGSVGKIEMRTVVDSDEHSVADIRLPQYTFRMLYSAEDLESSISQLLEIIGRSYNVSHAYIFESSEDGRYCSNTSEWCTDGVESQTESLQNLSYKEELGDYQKNFDENGISYCSDVSETHPDVYAVLEPQDICSMLQCVMLDKGEFVGYVGFDEYRENRVWNPKQIRSFRLTTDVFSIFTTKLRLKQKSKK